jgi:hypothetical protein
MSNPIPCGKCSEVADADLLVTDRTPDFQLLGTPTAGLCVRCYIEHAMQLANALAAAMAQLEAEGDPEGVLEAIEADEGLQPVEEAVPAAPKSKAKKEPATVAAAASEEAASADGVA